MIGYLNVVNAMYIYEVEYGIMDKNNYQNYIIWQTFKKDLLKASSYNILAGEVVDKIAIMIDQNLYKDWPPKKNPLDEAIKRLANNLRDLIFVNANREIFTQD